MTCLNTSYCLEACDGSCTPQPAHQEPLATIYAGDCVEVMAHLPEASVDAVVTDPPYELGFMGKDWDSSGVTYRTGTWAVAFRILKPGGHLLAFGGSRTYHRLACAIEDAGFEVRDCLMWLYGSGFPKSLDVSKAIDKRRDWPALVRLQAKIRETRTVLGISQTEAARRCGIIAPDAVLGGGGFMWFETGKIPSRGEYEALRAGLSLDGECDAAFEAAEREVTAVRTMSDSSSRRFAAPTAAQDDATTRYRLVEVTEPATEAARAWAGWGTALKPAHEPIILARKPLAEKNVAANVLAHGTGALNVDGCRIGTEIVGWGGGAAGGGTWDETNCGLAKPGEARPVSGRWPANVLLDAEAARLLDEQSGESKSTAASNAEPSSALNGYGPGDRDGWTGAWHKRGASHSDNGGASRFFYTSKAGAEDRDGSKHPTVKPVDLMKWLITLVTPPAGVVLDPFLGSGTTVFAARALGIKSIGIEKEPQSVEDAIRRLRQGVLL